jgi:hypothetical protein
LKIGLFSAWLSDRLDFLFFVESLAVCLIFPILILGIAEIQTRFEQRSKRLIKFQEKKIILKPCKSDSIPWKKVAKFQFEPIPETPRMVTLKLFLHGFPNQSMTRRVFWQMALENPSQAEELERYLRDKKVETPTKYEIEVLEGPAPAEDPRPFPFLGMSLWFGGAYFLLHGVPGLALAFDKSPHPSGGNSQFTPEASAKLGHFFARHFSSLAEFRHFFLLLNIGLIIAGVLLLILGQRLMKRQKQAMPTARSA